MHPRNIHFMCDMCLVLPFAGIIIAVFFSLCAFDMDNLIIKEMFNNWKNKPIHILQDSEMKTCSEMGMNDIITYEWPGSESGCLCKNKTQLLIGKCSDSQHREFCKSVERVKPFPAMKWKGHYLCASSIKSLSFFDLTKIKQNDFCAYKTKKCGRIDTLNNYLCIPENENCPLNEISFISNEDYSFELRTSNKNAEGVIYTSFAIAEEKVCLNHQQKAFQEHKYPLFNNTKLTCSNINTNSTLFIKDLHYKLFDSYTKNSFYRQNGIYHHIKHLPLYPTVSTTIGLYGSVYIGWKKECEKREFFSYMNNSTYADKEINDIITINNFHQKNLFMYTILLACLIVFGIGLIKYKMILTAGNKVEINTSSLTVICLIYLGICGLCSLMARLAHMNLEVIDNAKLSNEFFDMLLKTNCSDDKTNFILKYIAEEFFSYANRYFNIKMLSLCIIGVCFMNMFYSIFAKRSFDKKQAKKQKSVLLYRFDY